MTSHRSDRMMTAMFKDGEAAEQAYGCLVGRGYRDEDISLLMSDETRARCFPAGEAAKTEVGTKAAGGSGVGAIAGGGLGALLAGLAAAGIAVPGLPIIALGPLTAAIAGGATGVVAGAVAGALIGYGIPEERAKHYDRGVAEGGIVIGVTPRSDEDADYIAREWRNARGEQIYWPVAEEAGRRR